MYLLDSLATIKSIVLICDLPGADDLITTYFESFVDIVRYVVMAGARLTFPAPT